MVTEQLYSREAEQAVIGGVLIDARAWDRVELQADEFGHTGHREIWRVIGELKGIGDPVDVVTVSDRLAAGGVLEDVGGLAYLGQLAADTPSAANVAGYAKIVRDFADRRALLQVSADVSEAARDRSRTSVEAIDAAQRAVLLVGQHHAGGLVQVGACVPDFLEDLERRAESKDGMLGVGTGLNDIDHMMHGMERGNLIVLAGRPSMGKSLLGVQWAEHVAERDGPAAIFSLEMQRGSLLQRSVARRARVDYDGLRSGQLPEQEQWTRVNRALVTLRDLPLFIDDTAGISVSELRSRARSLHRRHALKIVVVDYLQLIYADGVSTKETRERHIAYVTQNLKELAKELDVPVLALAQLNRSLENRHDKRPVMSDLRESGQIEQDADVIAFIYRDEVYDPDTAHRGVAEILFRKQRNGPTGTVYLTFIGHLQTFENIAPDSVVGEPMPKQWRGARGFDA